MTRKKDIFRQYIERFARFEQQLQDSPDPSLQTIITIPCLNEPNVMETLDALYTCDRPEHPAEVLIGINHSANAPEEVKEYNEATYRQIEEWSQQHADEKLRFYPLYYPDIKPKIAGVGTARKAVMDEAIYRFSQTGNSDGIIVCLDADCQIDRNYLRALESHFSENPKTPGCSIYFEHPLEGPGREEEYRAILDFELYLRYYKNAFYWARFPYAYHTIGSCMAARADAYMKVGGMNKQQAGEDFYFLEKLIYQGHFTELNETRVIPAPRKSLRVPFGTGQAVTDYIEDDVEELKVFDPQLYYAVRTFVEKVPALWHLDPGRPEAFLSQLPDVFRNFLGHYDFIYYWRESQKHAADEQSFLRRFFQWFDAFMALKFLHYGRNYYHPNIPVSEATGWLLGRFDLKPDANNKQDMLKALRAFDKKGTGKPNKRVPF